MTKKSFHNINDNQNKPLVLIAGGAGFIGSYVCELLLQQNCRVICLDNLITGTKENLRSCLDNSDFLFIEQDLNRFTNRKIGKPNYIFHLAGLEAYIKGPDLSLEILLANVSGTTNLLKLAEETGAKFLLGSSQRVFQARISNQKMIDYFGKGTSAEIASFSEAKRSAEALTIEYMENRKVDARIVRLDWVYGPRMNLKAGNILAQMIGQAINGGPIEVLGDGSKKIRPTFIGDVVYGLSKSMFGPGTSGKIYNLVSSQEETLLSFAYQLQKQVNQNLRIEYVAEGKTPVLESKESMVALGRLNWQPKISLDEGLKQTFKYFEKQIKKPIESKLKTQIKKKAVGKKRITKTKTKFSITNKKKTVLVSILLILAVIFYLPGLLIFNSLLGINSLRSAYQAATEGNFSKTVSLTRIAKGGFRKANENLRSLEPIFAFVGQEKLRDRVESYLMVGLQAGSGLGELVEAVQEVTNIAQAIFQGQSADVKQLTSEIGLSLDAVYEQFSYLEAEIKSKSSTRQFLERFDEKLVDNLSLAREMILKSKKMTRLLPETIGLYEKKVYLVLFQNNMELRATGGFIGSFGLVTFENGKLVDFQVSDTYSADGQLKGHVDPPTAIRDYLGEAGWYLRDSNFNPDFPTSARRAAWFLEKEIGRKVDGVLAIDLFLIQKILRVIGPIDLIDYDEKINADNLFERAEYYTEASFFPGSTQKKDFLGALANSLFEEIHQAEEGEWLAVSQAVYQSLRAKDLLIYFNDPEAANVLADLGWDGSLRGLSCEEEEKECLVDYLMIVESNFGINKANYFVKRNLTHRVNFDSKNRINEILRIDYHNQSQSEVFPAGRYKNYLRILVPEGTKLKKVTIDGEKVDEDKIDEEGIKGKTAFGFLVEVPIQTKKTVEISYQLADKLSFNPGSRYLLYLQKQPGIEDEVFDLWLVPSSKKEIVFTRPEANTADGLVVFAPKFDQDLIFEISF